MDSERKKVIKTMVQLKSSALPGAWICNPQDRGRKSIKDGKIYLNKDQEFIIELFNPLQRSVLADIKIEGKSVSSTGLVINPGQRAYLECFVDSKRKFTFKTYEVDGGDKVVQEAIKNNGLVEIFFYEEQIINYYPNWNTITWTTGGYYYGGNTGGYYSSNGTSTYTTNISSLTSGVSYTNNSDSFYSKSLETGKVEGGNVSSQKFEEVYKNFNSFVLNKIEYKLLPTSQQPKEIEKIPSSIQKLRENNWKDILVQLKDLYDIGVLTSDEYEKKKNEILSRI
jgi:hypothetical protein